jgi:hypothetical protein
MNGVAVDDMHWMTFLPTGTVQPTLRPLKRMNFCSDNLFSFGKDTKWQLAWSYAVDGYWAKVLAQKDALDNNNNNNNNNIPAHFWSAMS